MRNEIKASIRAALRKCVLNTIERVRTRNGYQPFHEALLTGPILKASAFERSFSTSFGQGAVEEISQIVAESNGFLATRQYALQLDISKGAQDECTRILSALRAGTSDPSWSQEIKRITALTKGDRVTERVIADLHLKDRDNKEIFLTIKTVQPNLDQTQEAKKFLLLLKAHDPGFQTYMGLYYNPCGHSRSDYNISAPKKIFDMQRDPCVLIGKDYWDFLGGAGTYESLLGIFAEIGVETRGKLEEAGFR